MLSRTRAIAARREARRSRILRASSVAAGIGVLSVLWGCVSFYDFEPPPGHPARPDTPSPPIAAAPDPYGIQPPFGRKDNGEDGPREPPRGNDSMEDPVMEGSDSGMPGSLEEMEEMEEKGGDA